MGKSCLDAYERGRSDRAGNPLPTGAYKLREARSRVDEWALFAQSIREPKADPRGVRGVLRKAPEQISFELGRNIVPAIAALRGDGVAAKMTDPLARQARTAAEALVRRCDQLSARMSGKGIYLEIAYIRNGYSEFERLLRDVSNLIDDALHEVPKSATVPVRRFDLR